MGSTPPDRHRRNTPRECSTERGRRSSPDCIRAALLGLRSALSRSPLCYSDEEHEPAWPRPRPGEALATEEPRRSGDHQFEGRPDGRAPRVSSWVEIHDATAPLGQHRGSEGLSAAGFRCGSQRAGDQAGPALARVDLQQRGVCAGEHNRSRRQRASTTALAGKGRAVRVRRRRGAAYAS